MYSQSPDPIYTLRIRGVYTLSERHIGLGTKLITAVLRPKISISLVKLPTGTLICLRIHGSSANFRFVQAVADPIRESMIDGFHATT